MMMQTDARTWCVFVAKNITQSKNYCAKCVIEYIEIAMGELCTGRADGKCKYDD